MTTIEIDLDVYKGIEARRISFDESHNDILRGDYGVHGIAHRAAAQIGALPIGRAKQSRRSGNYAAAWLGGDVRATSLKSLLKGTILELAKSRPGFIDELSKHRTSRGRRIVARKAEELYPNNPQLVEHGAEQLDSRWWYDTNVSTGQCSKYLAVIGELSGVGNIALEKHS